MLLVEDDASISRFVSLAIEGCAIEVVHAADLQAAIGALRSGPFVLVLCDLMLPDGNGLDLLRALADADSPSPEARRVAFSAGVTARARAQLLAAGVHAVLVKPVSLGALLACVEEALEAARERSLPRPGGSAEQPSVASDAAPEADDAGDAVARYFGGHQGLYDAFAAQCRKQFEHDMAVGDAAVAAGDAHALRRLAHSLKSVLLTLGHRRAATLALAIDEAVAGGHADTAREQWLPLRERLHALAELG